MIVVIRGKGSMAAAGLVLIVHVPFLIGILSATQGAIVSYDWIAMSATSPSPAEVADGNGDHFIQQSSPQSRSMWGCKSCSLIHAAGYATCQHGVLRLPDAASKRGQSQID